MSSQHESAGLIQRGPQMMTDTTNTHQQMAIVEKYERFIEYIYPVLQNAPRKHAIARDAMLRAVFDQVDLFIIAGKSRQVSRLYSADANLALLRFWLRFLASPARKIITPNQHRVASTLLAEVGGMIGAWIKVVKARG